MQDVDINIFQKRLSSVRSLFCTINFAATRTVFHLKIEHIVNKMKSIRAFLHGARSASCVHNYMTAVHITICKKIENKWNNLCTVLDWPMFNCIKLRDALPLISVREFPDLGTKCFISHSEITWMFRTIKTFPKNWKNIATGDHKLFDNVWNHYCNRFKVKTASFLCVNLNPDWIVCQHILVFPMFKISIFSL